MAREIVITDDLDGSPNATTITYTFEGQGYEIDLGEGNLEKLRKALQPYLEKSRPVEREQPVLQVVPSGTGRGRRKASNGGGGGSGRSDLGEVRAWAIAQGKDVKERGRIKQSIIDEYDKAHQ